AFQSLTNLECPLPRICFSGGHTHRQGNLSKSQNSMTAGTEAQVDSCLTPQPCSLPRKLSCTSRQLRPPENTR
ncbi:hypothetical protein LEMLEM_LOCUS24803, partial [Lemmus lemmus]